MDKKDLMIADAVTRDINNPESPLYRIIEIKGDMLVLRELISWPTLDIELHKDQVHLVLPYPSYI